MVNRSEEGRGKEKKKPPIPCVSQSATVKEPEPELAALAHALCWTEQLRCRAAPALTKVSPLTLKGRLLAASLVTGGGAPPSAPVKVWTLVPVALL